VTRGDVVATREQARALMLSLDKFIEWAGEDPDPDGAAETAKIVRRLKRWRATVQDVERMATVTMLVVTPVTVTFAEPAE